MGLKHLVPTEADELKTFAEWADLCRILWCHVPNEGIRGSKIGVKKGVQDILVFDAPIGLQSITPAHVGIAIELKRSQRGLSRVSAAQTEWLLALAARGWATTVCYGAGEAIDFCKRLGVGR